jgi:hypothetical protein
MNRAGRLVAIGCLVVTAVAGCSRTTSGLAAQSEAASSTATSASSPEAAATASTEAAAETTSSTEFKLPAYGVEPTTKRPLAAGEVTCEADPPPTNPVEATSAAAGSPTVVLGLPDGFTSSPGQGDVALNLAGPDGLTGR